jgi:hypothetical protein
VCPKPVNVYADPSHAQRYDDGRVCYGASLYGDAPGLQQGFGTEAYYTSDCCTGSGPWYPGKLIGRHVRNGGWFPGKLIGRFFARGGFFRRC